MVTEPLGLEYLAAVATSEGCEYLIHDPVVTGRSFANVLGEFDPQVVAITGYYPAKDAMLECAMQAKKTNPKILTIIGGVHAEINQADFYSGMVDLVVHSGGTETFRRILESIKLNRVPVGLPGTCHRLENGQWVSNDRSPLNTARLPVPDRTHFFEHYDNFGYLHYGPVALVKTAYGCPFGCKFCYCRMLNEGRYTRRDLEDVVSEIKGVNCNRIWIVDDTFLLDMNSIRKFADLLEREGINREFIIYSRADFIADNPEVLPLLKRIGVIDVIVGMEAIKDEKLRGYSKDLSKEANRRCVELLKKQGIECTALFIMDIDSTFADFRALDRWIRKTGVTTYTLSAFTPYPGTEAYDLYRDKLTTSDCRKWDLSHLVLKPTRISKTLFYTLMRWMHLKVLVRNRSLRRHIMSFKPQSTGGVS